MAAAGDPGWRRQRLSKGASYCLILFLISSSLLFTATYLKPGTFIPAALFDLNHEDASNNRDFSNILHPEEHNSRAPTTIKHRWNITKGYRSPDGVKKLVYLINDQFPGPTIEARSGDTLEIIISNNLENEEGTTIHWHGLHMRGANDMDGAVGITQDAIPAGQNFTYHFKLSDTQAGTFWYHSHSALQRSDGLYGGLIIHKPLSTENESERYSYNQEQLFLIGDWYHRSAEDVQASYLTFMSSGHEPVPDSLLMNGLGAFGCEMAVPSRPVECENVERPSLKLGEGKTRLRIVNVGAMSGFNISLPDGEMEAIQIDGGNQIIPTAASEIGILYPGERVDVITSSSTTGNISITLDPELFTMQNPALATTQSFPLITSHQSPSYQPPTPASAFDLSTALSPAQQSPPLPATANQTLLLYTHIDLLSHNDHIPLAFLNRTTFTPQSPPLISLSPSKWNENQLVPEVVGNSEWVDIIVNNLDKDAGHPFHLHGHDFYLLTRHAFPRRAGYRTYNPFNLPSDSAIVYPAPNLINPPLKDTVHIPRRGYVILRIRADSPGLWFFHCHVLWHAGAGMGMTFFVSDGG